MDGGVRAVLESILMGGTAEELSMGLGQEFLHEQKKQFPQKEQIENSKMGLENTAKQKLRQFKQNFFAQQTQNTYSFGSRSFEVQITYQINYSLEIPTGMTNGHRNDSQFRSSTWIKDSLTFIALVSCIYVCYITSAVYHQKILKHQYVNPETGQTSLFEEAIIFTIFPQLFATLIGLAFKYIISPISSQNSNVSTQMRPIPWTKAIVCGLIVNFNMYTYNQAVVQASFPAVVMVKSCSLLSVILVGVFCSRVKDKKLKLGKNKILIGLCACFGILVFNFFKENQHNSVDRPITLISSLLLIASLIGDGFLPDLQAEIKSQYKPSTMEMYLQINKYTFLLSTTFSLLTGKIFYFYTFFSTHDQIVRDIVTLSILNAVGQIIIYKMINLYKQHIPAFIIGIRKCLTVVVNIFYFGHSVNLQQSLAMVFVFASIMLQTYDNYLEKKEKDAKMDKDFVEVGKDEYDPAEMYPIKDELNSETSIKFEEVRLGH